MNDLMEYPTVVIPALEGSAAVLVASYEGSASDPDRDAIRFAFRVATAPATRPHRIIVLVDRLYASFATPAELGIPAGVTAEAGLAHLCVAAMGLALDGGAGAGTLEAGQPPILTAFSEQIGALRKPAPATDEEALRYMAAKLYWSWKHDQARAVTTYPDFWRLGLTKTSLERIMMIGEGQYWKLVDRSEHSLLFEPLPILLQGWPAGKLPGVLEPPAATLVEKLNIPRYAGVGACLRKAEQYMTPGARDLENAAKEAIGAVEALARIVTGDPTRTLGALISDLRSSKKLDGAIAKTFDGLWGFASNAPGVRHGAGSLAEAEARLVVDMARAAVDYLLALDT